MSPLQIDDPVLGQLVRHSPLAIVVSTRTEGRILDANDAFLRLFGYTREEVIGQTSTALGMWADREQRARLTATLMAGQPLHDFEATARTKRGEERQVLATVSSAEIDNQACLLTQLYDISAHRQAERQFQALTEHLPVIVYTHALDDPLTMTYVSPQIETLLGFTPEEVLAGEPSFLAGRMHPDDRAGVLAAAERARATGEPFRAEYRLRARDGRWVWLQDETALVRDAQGNSMLSQGVLVDVTERRGAEAARDRAERRYRELFDEAPVMYVITRNEAGTPIIAECNTLFLSALGYKRDEVVGRSLADFYTAESQAALFAGGYAAALTDNVPATELELVTKEGRVLDVLFVTRPEFGDTETSPGTRVGFIDVTARVAAEVARRESEERLRTIVDAVPTGIVVQGAAGDIVLANPAAEHALGLTIDQLAGRTSLDPRWAAIREDGQPFPGEEHPAMVTLRTGHPRDNVIMGVHRPNGAVSWISINSRALVRDRETAPYAVVSSFADLTERFRLEQELREREKRFRALVQNSYDVIIVLDATGNRTYVSPSIERVLGYPSADLVGRSPTDLIHPDDAPLLQAAITACLHGATEVQIFELRLRHRDGGWRDFEAIGTNLLDEPSVAGIVINSREITARKAAQAALHESEERFRSAFDHAPIGIALVAPDGHFLQVNRALCELVGYAEHELLGQTFQAITHPDDLAGDLELAGQLWAGEIDTYQLEKRYIHKAGNEVWVLLTGSTVRDGAAARYAIAQIVDVTERRHLELERAEMLATEQDYSRQLRDLTTMRADLTAMIAHELHAPVSALRMMTFLLRTGKLSAPDEAAMFDSIDDEIARLDRLINDVAGVTVAENEDFAVHLRSVHLATLCEDAEGYARTTLRDHPFSVVSAPDVRVRCDPERITQVLRNLLDNAGKHTPVGTAVELRASREGPHVRVEVIDHGPGLSPEDVAVIFEKFGRGQNAAARQLPGAGLGLYLSRRILLAHRSDLLLQSAPGQATVFAFDLEIAP